jgi:hypothetical protein
MVLMGAAAHHIGGLRETQPHRTTCIYAEHAASVCAQPCPHLDAWAYAYADKERQELQDEVARLICETLRLAQLQVFSMGIMRVSRVVCASRHTEVVMIR